MKVRKKLSRQERKLRKTRTVTFNVAKLQELRDRVQADIEKHTIYSPTDMSNESNDIKE